MIYLTSFFRVKDLPPGVSTYSAAVYQPKGFDFPKVHWADIRKFGKWTRPRDFMDTPDPMLYYHDALYELYMSRKGQVEGWLKSLGGPVALCCWCPYDKAAKRQLDEWGSFICHTGVIGEFLTNEMKVPVWYDGDRRTMTTLARGTLNAIKE